MTDTFIHPTAIVDPKAQLGQNVTIGPYCVIGEGAKIGDGSTLKSHVSFEGDISIGEKAIISPFVSFGPPQDMRYAGESTKLIIGKNAKIFEHVTMNTGTVDAGGETRVGDNAHFMVGVHIAHDCRVGNNVIMANNATLGGHVTVGNYCVIGGLSAVHQFIRIGDYAVIGGMSGVESDVIPFGRVKGDRAYLAGLNLVGLERNGFSKDDTKLLQRAFKALFDDRSGTFEERISDVSEKFEHEAVKKIIDFALGKERFPICQPKKKN